MGRDKTRIKLGNKTMLDLVQAAAVGTGLPVRIIRRDLVPRCGPIGGVYTAFQKCKADAILFLACDMPFVTSDLILRFIRKFETLGRPVFARAEAGGAPGFPFILPASAAPIVRQQIRRREFSLFNLATKLHATTPRLPGHLHPLLANINHPQDLRAARNRKDSKI
jgi:molybdopterin-guanine dinucleotide biosynthesis protein A